MTRTKKLLALAPVMQAFAAGKTIQVKTCTTGNWFDIGWEPAWDGPVEEYRVKPDLIEGYVNVYPQCHSTMYATRERADVAAVMSDRVRVAHLREVEE